LWHDLSSVASRTSVFPVCCSALHVSLVTWLVFCCVTNLCFSSVLQCVACISCDMTCLLLRHKPLFSSVLQCVAVCCSVLQCVAVCCSVFQCAHEVPTPWTECMLQHVAACCSMLQHVAACCSMLQHDVICCNMLQCVAVSCSAMCHEPHFRDQWRLLRAQGLLSTSLSSRPACWSSALQRVAVCDSMLQCVTVGCSVL